MDLGSVFALCIATFITSLVQLLVIAGLVVHTLILPRQRPRPQDVEAAIPRETTADIGRSGPYQSSIPPGSILVTRTSSMRSERIPPPNVPSRPEANHTVRTYSPATLPLLPPLEDHHPVQRQSEVSPLSSPTQRPASSAYSDSLYSDPTPPLSPQSRPSMPERGTYSTRNSLRDRYGQTVSEYLDQSIARDRKAEQREVRKESERAEKEAYERAMRNLPSGC